MKTAILIITLIAIGGAIFYLQSQKVSPASNTKAGGDIALDEIHMNQQAPQEPESSTSIGFAKPTTEAENKSRRAQKAAGFPVAKEISSPDGFINTPLTSSGQATPITISEHIGKKVILVDFWTYSCINCQRTLPYLTAWDEKYRDKGLVIVGMHTPEFKFEEKYENVAAAVEKFNINYPVVLDNDYSTWRSYQNRYWPRKYIIDIDGFIVYDHIGEGAYDETEKKIQELLEERKNVLGLSDVVEKDMVSPTGTETATQGPRSPEIYFGSSRNLYLGNGDSEKTGEQAFVQPEGIKTNILYLDGTWNITPEFATNKTGGAKIIFRYQGGKVFMVAGADTPVRATLLLDGEPLGEAAGGSVTTQPDGTTTVEIQKNRLYRLIEDPAGTGEHTLEIIIDEPGLEAFTFTFG